MTSVVVSKKIGAGYFCQIICGIRYISRCQWQRQHIQDGDTAYGFTQEYSQCYREEFILFKQKHLAELFYKVLGQLPPRKIVPNPKTNPNSNPNRGGGGG